MSVVLLTTTQAAEHAMVRTTTIRQWARRGKIAVQGYDQKGRALWDVAEVNRAELSTCLTMMRHGGKRDPAREAGR